MTLKPEPRQTRLSFGPEPATRAIQPRMVVLAREARGRTQKELAHDLGISQGELSKIEGGLRGVSDDLMDRLSKELHYPPSFFFQQEQIYGSGIGMLFHRKRQDIPAKIIAKVHAIINIMRIHVKRLLRAADVPPCRIPSLDPDDQGRPLDDVAIGDIARGVRSAWLLPHGPIENLCGVIEDAGGIVLPCDFGTRQIDAISQWTPDLPPLFFINTAIPQDRLRYSLAHELGHLIMHRSSHSSIEPTHSADIERQANTFASEFLMPEREIRSDLTGLSLARLAVLKPYWRVAMQALLMRAQQLGTISSRHAKTLWSEIARAGYRTREPAELDISGEEPSILRELLTLHRKSLGFSLEELAALFDLFDDETDDTYFPTERPHLRVVG